VATDRTRWTDGIASALGYSSGIISDVNWWSDRIHPDDSEAVRADTAAAMNDPARSLWAGEYRFRAADGRWLDIYNRSLFVRDGSGKCVRVVGSIIDVTEKKRLEQRLRMADRLSTMGTFAAGLAHEVRNPLTVAIGNLALARRALAAQLTDSLRPLEALLVDAEEGARRVSAVVDGLGMFNKKGDGHADVDVRSVVERALVVAGHDLTSRAKVDLELADVPRIEGDTQQLGQVVLNLLANAQQSLAGASVDDAHLRISLRAHAHHVVLEVEDTGEGILPEHLPRLFEPFFTTKPDGVGTGLGLAICREIVAAHGGTIEAASVHPHGAMFRVRLPFGHPMPGA
jgi:PAS domain S-box-containing protein